MTVTVLRSGKCSENMTFSLFGYSDHLVQQQVVIRYSCMDIFLCKVCGSDLPVGVRSQLAWELIRHHDACDWSTDELWHVFKKYRTSCGINLLPIFESLPISPYSLNSDDGAHVNGTLAAWACFKPPFWRVIDSSFAVPLVHHARSCMGGGNFTPSMQQY